MSFLVVVNGSTDRTAEIVRDYVKQFPQQVECDIITAPIGKGGAIFAGLQQAAAADVVGFVDADGATAPEEAQRLLALLPEHDVVIASRWMAGAKVFGRTSWRRRLGSRVFHGLVALLFRMPYRDTQCGAKFMTSRAAHKVLPRLGNVSNMLFDVELLYRLRQAGCEVHEEPTVWVDQAGSTVKMGSDSWQMFKTLVWFRWATWRGK